METIDFYDKMKTFIGAVAFIGVMDNPEPFQNFYRLSPLEK